MSGSDDWEKELEVMEEKQVVKEEHHTTKKKKEKKKVDIRQEMPVVDLSKLSGKTLKAMKNLHLGEEKAFHFDGTLRAPICCILGHVDTGKTKILDAVRSTNVQGGEAGGITQQIGATFIPISNLETSCAIISKQAKFELPGLLIIDTPGHESFNNLRARGTTLCDIAVLVVDIMHGLEPQTLESLELLRMKKAPFVIALNKVDRLYEWKKYPRIPFKQSLEKQLQHTQDEFYTRWSNVQNQIWEQSIDTDLWWLNKNVKTHVSVVPTSAHTHEGVADLLFVIAGLTQKKMAKALTYKEDFQCTVLEVKIIEGHGCTIDVILINGTLNEGDRVVCCGINKAICTTVKSILTPRPLKEIRVKGEYIHHKSIKAAMGIKIVGADLDECVAGTPVYKVEDDSNVEQLKLDVQRDMSDIFEQVSNSKEGVYVVASTLGSLEALLHFLKQSNIPVFSMSLGTVQKLDVKKAASMREQGFPQYAVILAFDVKISKEAELESKNMEVTIFEADIIYHLFDKFSAHLKNEKQRLKEENMNKAVFPCKCEIMPNFIIRNKAPIICGIHVVDGELRVGTPLYMPRLKRKLGVVESIQIAEKDVEKAIPGQQCSVKINSEPNIQVGRNLNTNEKLISHVTPLSMDCTTKYYEDELTAESIALMEELKLLIESQTLEMTDE